MTEALIYDHVRTPRGKGKKDGSLHEVKVDALTKFKGGWSARCSPSKVVRSPSAYPMARTK